MWGDQHAEKSDPLVDAGCFGGPKSMIEVLRPREQHIEDLCDFMTRNHHNLHDPYFRARQAHTGPDLVEYDIQQAAARLELTYRPWCRTVVVESNHDLAFRRWLQEADGHRDPLNARYWHYWNYRIFEAIQCGQDLAVFETAVRDKMATPLHDIVFLREDDSWVICPEHGGIECALHGHRGPNGSRGSPRSFGQLGMRCNTGHTHTAGIIDGVFTAGVSGSLDMGYNVGPSSWSHSHILTYESGKRAIVTQQQGRWRGA